MSRRLKSSRKSARGFHERNVDKRAVRECFLIVCEGQETEPNYFTSFKVPKDVITVIGTGTNTVNVVRKAIELRDRDREEYDQTWCVFDRDDVSAERFNAALQLARDEGIEVAYSNEAFELWYLLHFCYYNSGNPRQDYINKLDHYLGHPYEKNSRTMYDELLPYQQTAIANATRLLAQYDPPCPEQDNPSTTVHLLVQELNRFLPGT